jgi:ABC-type nitrate/sulfonate/bicarbonate transport system permease component
MSDAPQATKLRATDTSGKRKHASELTRWAEFRSRKLGSYATLFALLVAWQTWVTVAEVNPIVMPPPTMVVREMARMHELGFLVPAFVESMTAYAAGVSLALVVGMALSIAIGLSKFAQVVTQPYLWALFAMPRVALIPLLLLWFGLNQQLVIVTVFLSAVVPLVLQVLEGMRTADGLHLRMSRMFCASKVATLYKVVFPGIVPFVANGMRQALSRGFIGLIVVELLTGTSGLGSQAMRASTSFNTARTMAMILIMLIVAVLLVIVSRVIERSASRWRESVAV